MLDKFELVLKKAPSSNYTYIKDDGTHITKHRMYKKDFDSLYFNLRNARDKLGAFAKSLNDETNISIN